MSKRSATVPSNQPPSKVECIEVPVVVEKLVKRYQVPKLKSLATVACFNNKIRGPILKPHRQYIDNIEVLAWNKFPSYWHSERYKANWFIFYHRHQHYFDNFIDEFTLPVEYVERLEKVVINEPRWTTCRRKLNFD